MKSTKLKGFLLCFFKNRNFWRIHVFSKFYLSSVFSNFHWKKKFCLLLLFLFLVFSEAPDGRDRGFCTVDPVCSLSSSSFPSLSAFSSSSPTALLVSSHVSGDSKFRSIADSFVRVFVWECSVAVAVFLSEERWLLLDLFAAAWLRLASKYYHNNRIPLSIWNKSSGREDCIRESHASFIRLFFSVQNLNFRTVIFWGFFFLFLDGLVFLSIYCGAFEFLHELGRCCSLCAQKLGLALLLVWIWTLNFWILGHLFLVFLLREFPF